MKPYNSLMDCAFGCLEEKWLLGLSSLIQLNLSNISKINTSIRTFSINCNNK